MESCIHRDGSTNARCSDESVSATSARATEHERTSVERPSLVDELPEAFRAYLQRHAIPLEVYDAPCPRYVRVMDHAASTVPLTPLQETGSLDTTGSTVAATGVGAASTELAIDATDATDGSGVASGDRNKQILASTCLRGELLAHGAWQVSWLPGRWWALPQDSNVSRLPAYRSGHLFGMDAASAFAVLAMAIEPGHDVLDLCCAPGAKLVYIAELLQGRGRLVGVDVAEHRLAACRTLCRKYGVDSVTTLLEADGTTWSLPNWSIAERLRAAEQHGHGRKGRKRRREQALANLGGDDSAGRESVLFDRVLVDAECTHDGSVKHIEKYRLQWGGLDTLDQRVPWLSPIQLEELVALQRRLLHNGWRQLKPGGILVYSTCSFAAAQNEEVVKWLLDQEPTTAHLDPLPFELGPDKVPAARCQALQTNKDDAPVAAKFDPVTSKTSGLFLARLRKSATTSAAAAAAGVEIGGSGATVDGSNAPP
eukprot:TRINITY_DN55047_c0_g1_i1.p1 TRINITY_DN55047_c0_g1~~TRINITY_DN55047_c0_g1_i1.p1  ORF type:complete len:483 (+),score=82.15 TRINITY_DN55047_c0_g1_i1:76-1524(+)